MHGTSIMFDVKFKEKILWLLSEEQSNEISQDYGDSNGREDGNHKDRQYQSEVTTQSKCKSILVC